MARSQDCSQRRVIDLALQFTCNNATISRRINRVTSDWDEIALAGKTGVNCTVARLGVFHNGSVLLLCRRGISFVRRAKLISVNELRNERPEKNDS